MKKFLSFPLCTLALLIGFGSPAVSQSPESIRYLAELTPLAETSSSGAGIAGFELNEEQRELCFAFRTLNVSSIQGAKLQRGEEEAAGDQQQPADSQDEQQPQDSQEEQQAQDEAQSDPQEDPEETTEQPPAGNEPQENGEGAQAFEDPPQGGADAAALPFMEIELSGETTFNSFTGCMNLEDEQWSALRENGDDFEAILLTEQYPEGEISGPLKKDNSGIN